MPATTDPPAAPGPSTSAVPEGRIGDHRRALLALLERNVFVAVVLAACSGLAALVVKEVVGPDSWLALLGGRTIVRSGLPHHDPYAALTLGHRWTDQQWLGQLGLYGLWTSGGWALVAIVSVACFLAALCLAAAAARRLGASDRSVALVLLGAFFAGLSNTAIRTQILAYPLFALVLVLLLADARRASGRVFLVLPLLVVWANVHGSAVVGAGLVTLRGLALAADRLRARMPPAGSIGRAGALIALPWPCLLVSPYGLALPGYYRSVLANPELARAVNEWAPSTIRGQPLFFFVLLVGLWLAVRGRAALTGFATVSLATLGVFGLVAVRNEVWFALAVATVAPAALDELWIPSSGNRRVGVNAVIVAAAAVAAAIAIASVATHPDRWFERSYPPGARAAVSAAARSNPSQRIFANESYADWLLFTDPALAGRVAYDARFELLSGRQLRTIRDFRTEHGFDWQRAARGYGLLVLDPVDDKGAVRLFERSGATVLYRDRHAVVLRRAGL